MLHYKTYGTGIAVVMLHGFLDNGDMWEGFIPPIAESGFEVICPDLPGHGQSACIGDIHQMKSVAKAVNDLLLLLNIKRAILIGYSMGGYVALAFAKLFPSKIKGLCLINSSPFEDSKARKIIRNRAIDLIAKDHKTFIKKSIPQLMTKEEQQEHQEVLQESINRALTTSSEGIIATIKGLRLRTSTLDVLSMSKTQVFVILGLRDTLIPYQPLKKTLESLSQIDLKTIDAGHLSPITHFKEIGTAITHFCNQIKKSVDA